MEQSSVRVRDEPAPEWVAVATGVRARLMVEGNGSRIVLYRMDPGTRCERHRHPFPELGVVLIGRGRALIGDEVRTVREGDSLYIPSGVSHGFEADADGPVVSMNVTVPWSPEMEAPPSSVVRRALPEAQV